MRDTAIIAFFCLLIGVVLGVFAQPALSALTGREVRLEAHNHDHGSHDHGADHDHGELVSLPEGDAAPTLDFDIAADPGGGYNLHIRTSGFAFAPEKVNGAPSGAEGHAHVYVDGEKIARVYAAWTHIGALPEGSERMTVTLNSNDHKTLAVGVMPLSVTKPLP